MVRYAALKSLYDIDKTIGTGGFAKVKLATHLLTGEKVAIKIMDKELLGDDYPRVKMELQALKSISHHHICKLYQVLETPTHFFMIMEYCSGGELFDHIVEKSKLTEAEARSFFRQILSAVAYLHKKGYAHRDLKPENILLDKDLNLKLIDFGLCANPAGGMSSHLKTSCGSPTYAAPELIQGKKYLGSQVDVWSLGVLLYALLCGFLPFDSDSIESLYKKILSGVYDEPPWLTEQSKNIIKNMLQIDPKNRITIDQLLVHPWLTMGYYEPVSYNTLHEFHERDESVLETLAEYSGSSVDQVWSNVSKWCYDYETATYQLLLAKKKLGLPLKLNYSPYWLRQRIKKGVATPSRIPVPINVSDVRSPLSPSRESYACLVNSLNSRGRRSSFQEKENLVTPVKNSRKRSRCNAGDDSPIPIKITPGKDRFTNNFKSPSTPTNNSTPSKGKLLCSIEKKINQVRNVLTPRKKAMSNKSTLPILTTKSLCNVSTTSFTNPEQVLAELRDALCQKGIFCKNKGFTLRGKIEDHKATGGLGSCKLYFELEVCLVRPSENSEPIVGIRRKRLKGDAWCYRKVCEEVLKLTTEKAIKE
ncbi:maternal embryonic leucine zipper kinase-like [Cimex lectularius]|uniref:non-specific serine/threonine protein kinase n=1 Tax=Cimex lectularius TaxID=79782 RepID=A0A8I6TLH4_CIMLE|nr:maternal embryonic leucine zipper kinase-like [Cimex lectularius]